MNYLYADRAGCQAKEEDGEEEAVLNAREALELWFEQTPDPQS